MMKIKELTLSISEIVPMGEFRNAKPMMSITWEVSDGSVDFFAAQDELKERFSAWLPSIINRAEHTIKKEDQAENCYTHNIPFTKSGFTEKDGKKIKWSMHRDTNGQVCFGKGYLPKK